MTAKLFLNFFINMCLAALVMGCNNSNSHNEKSIEMKNNYNITEATQKDLETIKDKRILFLHHSVGGNILNGLQKLSNESKVDLKISIVDKQSLTDESYFAHWNGGKNKFPKSKVDSFANQVKNLNNEHLPQVAFMKFCFVDFNPDTDINELFNYYKDTMVQLRKERPDIDFLHMTVPLKERPYKLMDRVNRLLGRMVWEDESNIKRVEFNKLLYETYSHEQIFDIARIESTLPDGERSSFVKNGEKYYSLAAIYTDDGGHLNDLGQRRVASEMAHFLAGVLDKK